MRKEFKVVLATALVLALFSVYGMATAMPSESTCTDYAWNATTTDIAGQPIILTGGYKIYQVSDGVYTEMAQVEPGVTKYPILSVYQDDGVYETVITAYQADGKESGYSLPVTVAIVSGVPLVPGIPMDVDGLRLECVVMAQ